MPRFFFDFTDGSYATEDVDGHDLPCAEAARVEVLKALVEVYVHEPRDVDHRCVTCAVRDDAGTLVYRASLTLDGRQIQSR